MVDVQKRLPHTVPCMLLSCMDSLCVVPVQVFVCDGIYDKYIVSYVTIPSGPKVAICEVCSPIQWRRSGKVEQPRDKSVSYFQQESGTSPLDWRTAIL